MDWSFLIGKRLDQLCIGSFDVQLRFSDGISISIQADDRPVRPMWQKSGFETIPCSQRVPEMAASLASLVGQNTVNAVSENAASFALYFDNGEVLRIFDSSDSFESFTIEGGPRGVIVV